MGLFYWTPRGPSVCIQMSITISILPLPLQDCKNYFAILQSFVIMVSEVNAMAKCVRCGGSFLTRFRVFLKDESICRKCCVELGFPKDFYLTSKNYTWDEIKDGKDAYLKRLEHKKFEGIALSSLKISGAGHRDLNATDEEQMIFDRIKELFDENGRDTDGLELVRKSPNYVTVLYGEWDLVRIKFSDDARWLLFPIVDRSDARIYIESVDDINEYIDKLEASLAHIDKYSNK